MFVCASEQKYIPETLICASEQNPQNVAEEDGELLQQVEALLLQWVMGNGTAGALRVEGGCLCRSAENSERAREQGSKGAREQQCGCILNSIAYVETTNPLSNANQLTGRGGGRAGLAGGRGTGLAGGGGDRDLPTLV